MFIPMHFLQRCPPSSPTFWWQKIVYLLVIHETNRVLYKADYQLSLKVLFKDIKERIENSDSPHLHPP